MRKILVTSACALTFLMVGGIQAQASEIQSRQSVSTFDELKSALEDNNGITNVALSNDIQLTGGIRINANKKVVEIDGQGYKITENPSAVGTSTSNIYISDANGTKDVTLKNAIIEGKNYYGTIMISASATNVDYNVENVTYTGPQFMYNPQGYSNFRGNNDFTIQSSIGTAAMQEFAEVSGVNISGAFNLTTYTTGSYSAFWFDHSATKLPSFNVQENAKVNIDSKARQIFYTGQKLDMNVGKNAEVMMSTSQPLFDAGWMGNLTLGENSIFDVKRFATNWLTYPTLRLNGQLKTLPGATFVIENAPETTAVALDTAADSYIDFDSPKLIDLNTHGNTKAVHLLDTTLSFKSKVSEWRASNETNLPDFDSVEPFTALLAVNNLDKKIIYSSQVDAFDNLSIVNARQLQFQK
jgi:hypothetical protein